MKNAASRVHSHLQLNHTESTPELTLSIRRVHLCKHAQIGKHQYTVSHSGTCLLLHQGFMHAFIPGALPLLSVRVCVLCVCDCVIHQLCCISITTLD